jgi:hypothetical protein
VVEVVGVEVGVVGVEVGVVGVVISNDLFLFLNLRPILKTQSRFPPSIHHSSTS